MGRMLLGLAFIMISFSAGANIYTWSSGVILLPDGSVAGEGDVHAYVWQTHLVETMTLITSYGDEYYYGRVSSGNLSPMTGYDLLTMGASDGSGCADVTSPDYGTSKLWAVALYVCEYDGHEYYQRQNAFIGDENYEGMKKGNLAGGEWKLGNAIPESSSAMLILTGLAGLALRRRTNRTEPGNSEVNGSSEPC